MINIHFTIRTTLIKFDPQTEVRSVGANWFAKARFDSDEYGVL